MMVDEKTETPVKDSDDPERIVHCYAVYRQQFCTRTRSPAADNSDGFFHDIGNEEKEDQETTEQDGTAQLIEEEVIKLSLLSSNLHAEKETALRSLLTLKVQYGSTMEGNGNILLQTPGQLFDEACMVYFNLLNCGESVDNDQSTESDAKDKLFLVCFIVIADTGLELFHPDLDRYCKSLAPYLDKYMESVDVSDYLNLIESWYNINVCFVSRCINTLKDLIAPLLYHTLRGDKISLVSIPDSEREDIERLISCCSLSQLVEDNSDDSQVIYFSSPNQSKQSTFTLTSDGMMYSANSERTTPFCNDCVLALKKVSGDNPFKLRQILENYKLKVIQDMNTLKRLTKQAETDYYALFRAFAFLVNCNNGEILLQNAKIQNGIEENSSMKSILRVLEDYIEAKGGFKALEKAEEDKSKMQYMIKVLGH